MSLLTQNRECVVHSSLSVVSREESLNRLKAFMAAGFVSRSPMNLLVRNDTTGIIRLYRAHENKWVDESVSTKDGFRETTSVMMYPLLMKEPISRDDILNQRFLIKTSSAVADFITAMQPMEQISRMWQYMCICDPEDSADSDTKDVSNRLWLGVAALWLPWNYTSQDVEPVQLAGDVDAS